MTGILAFDVSIIRSTQRRRVEGADKNDANLECDVVEDSERIGPGCVSERLSGYMCLFVILGFVGASRNNFTLWGDTKKGKPWYTCTILTVSNSFDIWQNEDSTPMC